MLIHSLPSPRASGNSRSRLAHEHDVSREYSLSCPADDQSRPPCENSKAIAGSDRSTSGNPNRLRGEPAMPPLPREAAAEWKRIVPILMSLGILTIADGPALAIYCDAFALWRQARKQLARSRDLTSEKARRLFSISEKSMKLAKSVLVEFGLTPASRPRLASFCILPMKGDSADPASEYFKDPPIQ